MARRKTEVRSFKQAKLRRVVRRLYPHEEPSKYKDTEFRKMIVDYYGGSHKRAEDGVAALEAESGRGDSGENEPKGALERRLTYAATAAMALPNNANSQPLSNQIVGQAVVMPAAAATIFSKSTIARSLIVDEDVEPPAVGSLPGPVPSIQQTSHQAIRSYDDIVQDAARPRTKRKRSSWAGGYTYDDENDEQTVKDVKRTTFSLPAESGDPKKNGQQTALMQLVIPFNIPDDIIPGSAAAMTYATSQLLKDGDLISHCLTTKGIGSEVYGNFLGVSRFEATCEDKMKIDHLTEKVAELDSRLSESEKKNDQGKAEWEKKHDESKSRIEELEAQMRAVHDLPKLPFLVFVIMLPHPADLHATRKGMRRIRKRCVMDFKRSKSTILGGPESEDSPKARIEGNTEAHEGNCTADTELCIQKEDMPGLDKGDEVLIEDIYGFTVDQIREVQTDKVLTKFIDTRGSIALEKNISLEEGKLFFDKVNDLYQQRRSNAVACANDEKVKDRRQLEKEAGYVALEKAIEQEYRRLREVAHSQREYNSKQTSQAFTSPDT